MADLSIRAACALLVAGLLVTGTVEARGRHGFHAHRGFGGHARLHCHTYRDQDGRRERVCL